MILYRVQIEINRELIGGIQGRFFCHGECPSVTCDKRNIPNRILIGYIKNIHKYADITLTRRALYFKGLNLRCDAFLFYFITGNFRAVVQLQNRKEQTIFVTGMDLGLLRSVT